MPEQPPPRDWGWGLHSLCFCFPPPAPPPASHAPELMRARARVRTCAVYASSSHSPTQPALPGTNWDTLCPQTYSLGVQIKSRSQERAKS